MAFRTIIVDDSIVFRKVMRDALTDIEGVEVIDVARDGLSAMEKITRQKPDLVTLDIEMPGLNGLQVLEELKRRGISTRALVVSSQTKRGAEVIDMMTTHETLFFRDMHPFEVLIDNVIPELLQDKRRTQPVEIHCAACSSGQEPYSIAMMLHERLPAASHAKTRITATDISTGTIATARKGEFMDHELRRGLTPAQRKKFFEPVAGAMGTPDSRLIASVRNMVRFSVMNLTSKSNVSMVAGKVDIMLCRNVLIYFDKETCQEVMQALASVIRPGGLLLLGASEMLRDSDGLFQTEIVGSTRFQRRV